MPNKLICFAAGWFAGWVIHMDMLPVGIALFLLAVLCLLAGSDGDSGGAFDGDDD